MNNEEYGKQLEAAVEANDGEPDIVTGFLQDLRKYARDVADAYDDVRATAVWMMIDMELQHAEAKIALLEHSKPKHDIAASAIELMNLE